MAAVLAPCERHGDVPCRCPRPPAWPDPVPSDVDALLDAEREAVTR